MNTPRALPRAVAATALASALALCAPTTATAATTTVPAPAQTTTKTKDGWQQDGLHLNATDNAKVDAFIADARQAERTISPQVRAAAWLTDAELIGFENRLKSPDSLKRKVATAMKEAPGQSVEATLATINDAVRYTLQWPDARYTTGVIAASSHLAAWGNDSVRWKNTWGSSGYKGVNSAWRAPRSGMRFEIQFHTPASKWAQEETHKLYEEQRLPGTSPERKKRLQEQQNAIFASVPVPEGADRLTAPAPAVPHQPQPQRAKAATASN
ncbi:ATP nucleotide 3'-pyrophosphokinase [Streptomyces thermolilacinus]|uniref:ATP nucleotide 3'-pyrophosphokinase n=1 Tax=Streptomyces thermolilacinus SPC6 TaxID=1306406 RepID=A0A1D3DRN2_9ACTN|nr:ATP nucleotide 3'-pyrophosphokinase [Streptomyces thermolilacinus]OEJ94987.1 ATP nucleotide 3'-pyrophosphokinase [Streptomyces thermolilacinus SPC6]